MAEVKATYRITPSGGVRRLNLRQADGTRFPIVTGVRAGQKLVVIENPELALAKLGQDGQWINIRTPDNKEAWCAAWLLEATPETEAALANDTIPAPLLVTATVTSLNVRSGDLTRLPPVLVTGRRVGIAAGESVEILEDPSIAFKKMELGAPSGASREFHWIHIKNNSGIEGWAAAWYLTPAPGSDIPPPLLKKDPGTVIVTPDDDVNDPTPPEDPSSPTMTIKDAQAFIKQAHGVDVTLNSIDEFDETQRLVAAILNYGIGIRNSHESPGNWTLDEVRQVHRVIEKTAQVTAHLFNIMYGIENKVMAFRALYAPMSIARDKRTYVGPGGRRWYAKNSNGFDLIFGDAAFFDGEQTASPLRRTKRTFTAEQLIAHEIAHAINWRYHVMVNNKQHEVDRYYESYVETADNLGRHDGYTFGAQSASEEWETVTDAIASLSLQLFTDDNDGKVRRQQISDLMKLVIRYRKEYFDLSDLDTMMTGASRNNPTLLTRMNPIVTLSELDKVDNWLATLPDEITSDPVDPDEDDKTISTNTGNKQRSQLILAGTSYVNVRTGPGTEFTPPIGRLTHKTLVTWYPAAKKRDNANRYDWVPVQSDTVSGWIALTGSVDFVEFNDQPAVSETLTNGVIDISHWQVITDWDLLVSDGVIGIIHKATQGTGFVDRKFANNRAQALQRNLMWGAYHFGTAADPIEQAKHYLSTIQTPDNTLLVLDYEKNSLDKSNSMSFEQAEAFVGYIKQETGKWCVLYTGNWYLNSTMPQRNTILKNCKLWIAYYSETPPPALSPWNRWEMWQYSDGVFGPDPKDLKGIGNVDRNLYNGTLAELKTFWQQAW